MVANVPSERKMFRVTPIHYVIFDEAHMLKNMHTQRYENLMQINVSLHKHVLLLFLSFFFFILRLPVESL